MQSLGAAPGQVLGAGVIGDIYKLEERGRAMAVFFAVSSSTRQRVDFLFKHHPLGHTPGSRIGTLSWW